MIQVLEAEYQWKVCHQKKHFSHLVRQSTLLKIGFNALKSVIKTESWIIKERWVSYWKKNQNITWWLQNKISDNYQGIRWGLVSLQNEYQYAPYQEKAIEKKRSNKRRKNQGKALEVQW